MLLRKKSFLLFKVKLVKLIYLNFELNMLLRFEFDSCAVVKYIYV